MKCRKLVFALVTLSLALRGSAQIATVDLGNLQQALTQVLLAREQLRQFEQLVKLQGDPASFQKLPGAAETLAQLGPPSGAKIGIELSVTINGQGGLDYKGQGYYRQIERDIPLADGTTTPRQFEDYQKFEALQQAVENYSTVKAKTQERRQALRSALRTTVEALSAAKTDAEVQKLQGVLLAQQAELANLNAEQAEAANDVLVRQAANQSDAARQEQALNELNDTSVQSGLLKTTNFFRTEAQTVLIPDPKTFSR